MYRILSQTLTTLAFASFAFGQAPQTATPQSATTEQAGSNQNQTFRGILMDASCRAIQSKRSAGLSGTATSPAPIDTSATPRESGAARDIPPADARSTATAAGAPSSTTSGERSRAADAGAGAQWTTVREKYRDCKVKPSTSSFAMMSNGQLYMIDDNKGSLREKYSTSAATEDWQSITLMGTSAATGFPFSNLSRV